MPSGSARVAASAPIPAHRLILGELQLCAVTVLFLAAGALPLVAHGLVLAVTGLLHRHGNMCSNGALAARSGPSHE